MAHRFALWFLISVVAAFIPAEKLSAQTWNYYYGNIHSHSEYSDGNQSNTTGYYTVKPCFVYADNSQHTDFFGISDHNHSMAGMSRANFHKGLLEADSVNQNGAFTTMYGMEYGLSNNGG